MDYANGDNGGGSVSQNQLKTENNGSASGSRQLAGVTTGAWVRYPNVNLDSNQAVAIEVRYDAPTGRVVNGRIEVYVDSLDNDPLGTINLPNTGSGWGTHASVIIDLLPPTLTGAHDLYFKFLSDPDTDHPYVGNFDYFRLMYTVKADLDAAIAQYSPYTENPDWYDAADYAAFADALAAAEAVSADPNAGHQEAADATSELIAKASVLRWLIIDELSALVSATGQANESDYTASSWATFAAAHATALSLSPTTNSHADYETALADLQDAYDALVLRLESATAIADAPTSIVEGEDVTFNVAVTEGATGEVSIVADEVTLTAVTLGEDSTAPVVLSGLEVGTYTLTAEYPGDEFYLPSTSEPMTLEVTAVVEPPDPDPAVTISAPRVSAASQIYGAANGRVTLTTTVTGTTAGTVTFRSGATVLGTTALTRQGSMYQASVTVPAGLAVGHYGSLTASVSTSDGKTVTSAAASASFRVVKASLKKLKAKTPKKAKRGKKTWVRVVVSKKLSNEVAPRGKVRIYVGKKQVRQVGVKKVIKRGGKMKLNIKKKFVKGKKMNVRAVFVPGPKLRAGVAERTAKSKIKVRR
ncbi:Ig-like domain (group 3) [Micrococcales bacterium KH10]|nr:Ig-like domain (group 3) [Micrococcales bacterium KH10]